jgi:ketosteroid isomerase-like protein
MVRVGFASLAILAFCSNLAASNAMADAKSDEAAIRALEDRFAAGVRAADVAAIMKVYQPGESLLVFDVVPPRQYVGAEAYRKDWQSFLGAVKGPVKFEISDLKVEADGPLAWSHSIQHFSGAGANGQPMDLTARVTDVYRKTPNGWRIVHEHVSVPVDLETGKADLQSKP